LRFAALAAAVALLLLGGRLTKPPQAGHLSIVVLPFANLSGDPAQDYFADGVTENLTTELSRIRDSFVVARNTAFTYKGKSVDAKEIGKELGVRYGSKARCSATKIACGLTRNLSMRSPAPTFGQTDSMRTWLISSRAGTEISLSRFDKAKSNLQQAIRLSPRDQLIAVIYTGLGDIEIGAGRPEAAIVEYRKALDAGDHTYWIYANLALPMRSWARRTRRSRSQRKPFASIRASPSNGSRALPLRPSDTR
jgi:tetratricopeptide (TPR) repeat protein